jgi:hypothetical protein
MNKWLSKCREGHQKCPQQREFPLPTRVIDVDPTLLEPRLVITDHRLGRWTALSHCWGSFQFLKTQIGNLDSHCEELPISSLPATFRDAVIITRALGIQYLWIDSLCIVQDSREDWLAESVMMGSVFKNAAVTIAADASPNSSVGIFGDPTEDRQTRTPLVKTRCHSRSRKLSGDLYFEKEPQKDHKDRGPLGQRGWALQEEILSPRILQFTKDLVFWRCAETRANEVFPDVEFSGSRHLDLGQSNVASSYLEVISHLIPRNLGRTQVFNNDILSYWYGNVVDAYMLRKLTYPSDKLVAIAGIAKEIQPYVTDSEYKAGLWMNDMHRGLLWSPIRYRSTQGAIRYAEYIAPSWSWASINFDESIGEDDERFVYRDLLQWNIIPLAKILDVSVGNENNDPFGQVKSGSLTIRGECCNVCSCTVPSAFFDDRISQCEGNDTAFQVSNNTRPPLQFPAYSHKGKGCHSRSSSSNIKTVSRHGYHGLPMSRIGRQGCVQDPEVEHKLLFYNKIAQFSQYDSSMGSVVCYVAALILEPFSKDDAVRYRRVGRALMTQDQQQEPIAWPTHIMVIV